MEKIKKFIKYLNNKRRKRLVRLVQKIEVLDIDDLSIQKLKGYKNLYKYRDGKIRIIFIKGKEEGIVINIEFRDKVYKNL